MGSVVKPIFRKTCRRYNDIGHAHALTFSCFGKQPFLSRDRARHWFITALTAAREKHRFDIWAYAIMPEHVHLIIYPRHESYSISAILSDMKQPVTRAAVKFLRDNAPDFFPRMRDVQRNGKVSYRFWQRGGGYDRNLFDVKEICEKINYTHENPVRRGLAKRPEDWLWSSARYYADRQDGPLAPDVDNLPDIRIRGGKVSPR